MNSLKGKDFISLSDFKSSEIEAILKVSLDLKNKFMKGKQMFLLKNKTIGLLFEKPSTRTRVSFEVAIMQLSGNSLYLRSDELQLKRGEPIKDTAKVLSGYLDALVIRANKHQDILEFAKFAEIPVINGLSELEHPTQTICDLLTIKEVKKKLKGLKICWIGDGNNVCNSLILGASLLGMDISIACPTGYDPNKDILKKAKEISQQTGSKIEIIHDPKKAAIDADVLYTDVWISMGQDEEAEKRIKDFQGFQINESVLEIAKKDSIVMHCLPAHRGMEITEDVLEGNKSVVWQQANNKLHGAKGILASIL
ncbi:MAG: ornithine carbamoyltransferase [Candidatus Bathyarchaeia archaeon]